jgi:hypothetical protein
MKIFNKEYSKDELSSLASIIGGITAIMIAIITLFQYCSVQESLELQKEIFDFEKQPEILTSTIIDSVNNRIYLRIENFSDYRAKEIKIELDLFENSSDIIESNLFNLRENQIVFWDITSYKPRMVFSQDIIASNNQIRLKISYKKPGNDKKIFKSNWFSINNTIIQGEMSLNDLKFIN